MTASVQKYSKSNGLPLRVWMKNSEDILSFALALAQLLVS